MSTDDKKIFWITSKGNEVDYKKMSVTDWVKIRSYIIKGGDLSSKIVSDLSSIEIVDILESRIEMHMNKSILYSREVCLTLQDVGSFLALTKVKNDERYIFLTPKELDMWIQNSYYHNRNDSISQDRATCIILQDIHSREKFKSVVRDEDVLITINKRIIVDDRGKVVEFSVRQLSLF